MFGAVLVKLRKAGNGNVQHKHPVSSEDFRKLYTSSILSTDNPQGLQNKNTLFTMIMSLPTQNKCQFFLRKNEKLLVIS